MKCGLNVSESLETQKPAESCTFLETRDAPWDTKFDFNLKIIKLQEEDSQSFNIFYGLLENASVFIKVFSVFNWI